MNDQKQQSVDKNVDPAVRQTGEERLCNGCAPSNAYLFSAVGALLVLGVLSYALVFHVWASPDGTPDMTIQRQWEEAHPAWSCLLRLTLLAIEVAAIDASGWKFASWIARWRSRGSITARHVAAWRLVVQIAFGAVVILPFALFPSASQCSHGQFPHWLLAIIGIPVILAGLHLRRASRNPMPKEERTNDQ